MSVHWDCFVTFAHARLQKMLPLGHLYTLFWGSHRTVKLTEFIRTKNPVCCIRVHASVKLSHELLLIDIPIV